MPTPTHPFRLLPLLLLASVLAVGCDSILLDPAGVPDADMDEPGLDEVPEEILVPCVDRDGDGFGRNCDLGADCDDRDPTRATECGPVALDGEAGPECEVGETEACYVLNGGDERTLNCSSGTRSCVNGLWSHCRAVQSYEVLARVGPVECDPCDVACARTNDTPTDVDLTPENHLDVVYRPDLGGITLEETGNEVMDRDGDGVPDLYDAFPDDPTRDGFSENGDIFVELPFGGPAVFEPVDFELQLNTADVYFLMDTTFSMQGEIDNLRNSLTTGNFILNPEACGLTDAPVFSDWTASYWRGQEFRSLGSLDDAGAPDFTRTETTTPFYNFGGSGPFDESGAIFATNDFAIRWDSTVTVTTATDLSLTSRTDDGVRVFVDGVAVINLWRDQGPTTRSATVTLDPGTHDIRMEYYENGGGAVAELTLATEAPAGFEGVVGAVRCEIPDIAIGVGFFDDLPVNGYGIRDPQCNDDVNGIVHDQAFLQLQPSVPVEDVANLDLVRDAIGDLSAQCGEDYAESLLPAMYAIATGANIADTRDGVWAAPSTIETAGPLPPDLTYDPSPPPGSGSGVEFDAGDVTATTVAYSGSVVGAARNRDFGCNSRSRAGDHTYRFTVSRRGQYWFEADVDFQASLGLLRNTGGQITCDEGTATDNPRIRRVLDPGEYFIVVDGARDETEGSYELAFGEYYGESSDYPYELGDLTDRFVSVAGNTDPMFNDYANSPCWGGNSSSSEDAYFRFTVTEPTNIAAFIQDASFNSVVRLFDGAGVEQYCNNGYGTTSHLFQRLEPGTYYAMVEGYGGDDGTFTLHVGAWQDEPSNWTPEQAACPDGTFGYPCFREETIPIVVVFTDAEMHNAPDTRNRYNLPAPAYNDAVYALNTIGARVIGIHSGSASSTSCSTPCNEYRYEEVCNTVEVCDVYGTPYDECRTRTNVCTSYSAYYLYCEDREVCSQGRCEIREVCWNRRDCLVREDVTDCWTVTPCDVSSSTTTCSTERRECIDFGETTCTTNYRRSEQHLRALAQATDAVDADGNPFVYQINSNGTGLSEAVVRAISELANYTRLDVTVRVNDNDATPDVDERGFVDSWTTVSTGSPPPESTFRCLTTHATWYEDCLPGTPVQFSVAFRNDHVAPAMDDQIFDFTIDVLGDGSFLLDTVNVRVVVPGIRIVYPDDGWFEVEYDGFDYCDPTTERPQWTSLEYVGETLGGSTIRFDFRNAEEEADLDTAAPYSVTVPTDETSPIDLSGDIQSGRYLRVRANILASPGRNTAPVLESFELRYNCLPAE
jgi:hypothetical protein